MKRRTIAEVADACGVTARTLRFYEDKGLIASIRSSHTRSYSEREVAKLRLILRAKRYGFSLLDIKDIIARSKSEQGTIDEFLQILTKEEVADRIRSLEASKTEIVESIASLRVILRSKVTASD